MKYFLFVILFGFLAGQNQKADRKIENKGNNSVSKIHKDVQTKDSIYLRWTDKMNKTWKACDSMPYFILDKQIERQLKSQKLGNADRIILNYQLVYNYYLRRFIYDSVQYRNKGIELLFKTSDSDEGLLYTSEYFKTTPAKMRKYLNEVKNAKNNKIQDSLVWKVLNSYQRLKDY